MDDWNPWPRPAVPQTVVVYQDGGMADAAFVLGVIAFALALTGAAVRLTAWLLVRGTPLVVRLVVAGTQALHAAAAGRLLDEPGPTAPLGREAVRC